ncbi:MAG: 3-deoxy-7-phosphoheptulonate synthase [Planctomycetota bacterium]|jgi:3-deoxy-7-phosphoheptulonate synthase|nr:3-deoxy-7-phosphoheptulonate synthase [Planctomycetota bacterium]
MSWSRESWRSSKDPYLPEYPDPQALELAGEKLKTYPPLVFAGEVRQLKAELALAGSGKSYILQGGDCAETFADFTALGIRDTFRVLLQMALIFTFVGEKPVIRLGRVAGQFAKPRSAATEVVAGEEVMTYRGDMINGIEPNPRSRTPDPERMLEAYFHSAATLNLLRAFAGGGYADLYRAGKWLFDFVGNSSVRHQYENLVKNINKTLSVMRAYTESGPPSAQKVDLYCSHEALFLPYEEALARNDSLTGDPVATSAHFLWLGERTRHLESPQVEFLRGLINPVGIKCGPKVAGESLEPLLERLDPHQEPGRITLILRAGVNQAEKVYSRLIRTVKASGRPVVWMLDPMHGNPRHDSTGLKTRYFSDILTECEVFINVCRAEGVHPAGFHLEMTGKNVTECIGGSDRVENLQSRYETTCDPRLNASQALEMAFAIAEYLVNTAPAEKPAAPVSARFW